MSPERFNECLRVIRWTPINIASALQCELSWIEALEAGNDTVPDGLATWKRSRKLMKHYHRHQPTEENGRHSDAANS